MTTGRRAACGVWPHHGRRERRRALGLGRQRRRPVAATARSWTSCAEAADAAPSASQPRCAAGDVHALAIRGDGSLWGWGVQRLGPTRRRHAHGATEPRARRLRRDWTSVACGISFTARPEERRLALGVGHERLRASSATARRRADSIAQCESAPTTTGRRRRWRSPHPRPQERRLALGVGRQRRRPARRRHDRPTDAPRRASAASNDWTAVGLRRLQQPRREERRLALGVGVQQRTVSSATARRRTTAAPCASAPTTTGRPSPAGAHHTLGRQERRLARGPGGGTAPASSATARRRPDAGQCASAPTTRMGGDGDAGVAHLGRQEVTARSGHGAPTNRGSSATGRRTNRQQAPCAAGLAGGWTVAAACGTGTSASLLAA